MRWRYELIDRYDNETVIDQPVGWDSLSLKLKRHPERHGTFRELQNNQFQFYNKAKDLLRAEYELYGIRGRYDLRIKGKCKSGFEEVYRGRVSFENYDFVCGNECYVKVDLEQIGAINEFINRFDQKVDLSATVAFDKTSVLTDYPDLTKKISLPSKAILLRSIANNTQTSEYIVSGDSGWFPVAGTGELQGAVSIPFNSIDVNNINRFRVAPIMDYFNYSNYHEQLPEIIENVAEQELKCVGTSFPIEFRVKGRYRNLSPGSGDHTFSMALKKGTAFIGAGSSMIQGWTLHSGNNVGSGGSFNIPITTTVSLAPGEKLYLGFVLTYTKFTNYTTDVRVEIHPETFFKASAISKCDATDSKVYMIHEAASRVIESITNNQLKLASSYYGRTDSMPYGFNADGCGSMRAITTGLDIRRAKLADGGDPKLFLSMKDVFESLNAIDNIGIGPEGAGKIVMENWRYFYQDDIILKCRNIETVEKLNVPGENYSTFKVGYDKWETEDYNGLDEFLTKREYRTALSEVQNPFEQFCKWVASGYAWEQTRRKGPDSKDWRYDNDTFLVCLERYYKYAGTFSDAGNTLTILYEGDPTAFFGASILIDGTVNNNGVRNIFSVTSVGNNLTIQFSGGVTVNEFSLSIVFPGLSLPLKVGVEVGNITNASNLLDPPSVYNWRISPLRNALRWFNKVANCYRNITGNDSLIFSAGEGNFVATGEMTDDPCRLEAGVLAENSDINYPLFKDIDEAIPFTRPERIKFSYPLSFEDYNLIAAKPYGLIDWQSGCEKGFAWIDNVEYFPEEGKAKFLLIPKVTTS